MHIVLLGRTGSGKTTFARKLHERFDLPHVSSGDIARTVAEESAAAMVALRQGAFGPEEPVRIAVRKALESADVQHGGWVLEGFPRTLAQLVALYQWNDNEPMFVHLECSTLTCIGRLTGRRRTDDNPDSIARKLLGFEEHTLPVLEAVSRVLYTINTEDPDGAWEQLEQLIS